MDFLEQMRRSSLERLAAARAQVPLAALRARARDLPPPPPLRLDNQGFDLIAELKLRSPAAGALRGGDEDVGARVRAYAQGGAAAVSVLTEPTRFDGALEHLRLASAALQPLGIPVMRKDFLVDAYQVLEARVAGAGGVLAILRMLDPGALEALLAEAAELGMFVLLEAFDAADLERLCELPVASRPHAGAPCLAGLNCRDLATLEIVPARLFELGALLPRALPRVAESGVHTPEDAQCLAAAGYQLALVGSALMTGTDPAQLAAGLITAGRRGAAGPGRSAQAPAGDPGSGLLRTPS